MHHKSQLSLFLLHYLNLSYFWPKFSYKYEAQSSYILAFDIEKLKVMNFEFV